LNDFNDSNRPLLLPGFPAAGGTASAFRNDEILFVFQNKKSPLAPPFTKGGKSFETIKKSPFFKGGFRGIFLLVVAGHSADIETRPKVLANPAKPDDSSAKTTDDGRRTSPNKRIGLFFLADSRLG
jgi:hypothetical protein